MLGNKFLGCFLFENDPFLGVSIDVCHFKKSPPNIAYHPFSDIHKGEIFFKSHNIISLTPHNADHITPRKLKKWEDIQDNQFLIVGGNTQLLLQRFV
jgi:hypothetical protein